MTNLQLTDLVLNRFGKSADWIENVQDRLGHDRWYSVDWSKIHQELGYQPRHNIDNSIDNLVKWYRDNES